MSNTPVIGIPDFDKLEIIKVGNGALPAVTASTSGIAWATGTQTNTYAHNLGFKPLGIAYMIGTTSPNGYYPLMFGRSSANFATNDFYTYTAKIYTDETNTYIQSNVTTLTNAAGGITILTAPVKFFLLRKLAD